MASPLKVTDADGGHISICFLQSVILGVDFWTKKGIIPDLNKKRRIFTQPEQESLAMIVGHSQLGNRELRLLDDIAARAFKAMPDGLGRTHLVEHRIKVKAGVEPVKQHYYPVSPILQSRMDEELKDMLNNGVIEKSHSLWASSVVMFRKKDEFYRLCIDYGVLNKCAERDGYHLLYVSATLGKLRDARFLCGLDISQLIGRFQWRCSRILSQLCGTW